MTLLMMGVLEEAPPLQEEALGALVEGHGHHPVGPDEGGLDAIAVVHVDVHVQHAPEVPEELAVVVPASDPPA